LEVEINNENKITGFIYFELFAVSEIVSIAFITISHISNNIHFYNISTHFIYTFDICKLDNLT